jgi:large subunit ribosomal protein L4
MALAARANEAKLTLVESFDLSGKTKEFVAWAKENGFDGKERVLLVTDNEMARRAARNLPWVHVMATAGLNVYDILRNDHVIADASVFDGAAEATGGRE